ncbi:unnamed protein product [Pedinophyceae sp. YPF-701]|nr:unnamed protein product [Pedinophyceae sp. YPF-701]
MRKAAGAHSISCARVVGHIVGGRARGHACARPLTSAAGRRAAPGAMARYIDIGANLLDGMYKGEYHGKKYHEPDLERVLQRAWDAGVDKMMITAGTLDEAKEALELAKTDERLYCTVGCHPTRCLAFEEHPCGADAYLAALLAVAREGAALGKVVAIGECGLDYARTEFCPADVQRKYFARQFDLARETGLPMFLHLRDATDDFLRIVGEHAGAFPAGVAHSFDAGPEDLAKVLANPQLFVGINGCSLKTAENVATAARVPLDRLMLETDCPWCDCRPSHASAAPVATRPPAKDKKKHDPESLVKGRNEPCNIVQIAEAIAGARGCTADEVAAAAHATTTRVFFAGK